MIPLSEKRKNKLKNIIIKYRLEINNYDFQKIFDELTAIDDDNLLEESFPDAYIFYHFLADDFDIDVLSYMKSIPPNLFYGDNYLTEITIPNNIEDVGCEAFSNCENLQEVKWSNNPKCNVIRNATFENCFNLTSFHIPDNVTELEPLAFVACEELKEVTLSPNTAKLQLIGDECFYYCWNLEKLMLPNHKIKFEELRSLIQTLDTFGSDYKLKIYGKLENIEVVDKEPRDKEFLEKHVVS